MSPEELAEAAKKRLNETDRFCRHSKMELTVVKDGYAEAEMPIDTFCFNGLNTVQGGAMFTLADFAFAGASNSGERRCVAMNATIHFLRPGTGARLKAVAEKVNAGKKTCLYEVSVFNDAEKLVAKVSISGFFLS